MRVKFYQHYKRPTYLISNSKYYRYLYYNDKLVYRKDSSKWIYKEISDEYLEIDKSVVKNLLLKYKLENL